MWKIPFIGPFLESVNPKFEKYHEKWLSGPLSCVSVFHKSACPLLLCPCLADILQVRRHRVDA